MIVKQASVARAIHALVSGPESADPEASTGPRNLPPPGKTKVPNALPIPMLSLTAECNKWRLLVLPCAACRMWNIWRASDEVLRGRQWHLRGFLPRSRNADALCASRRCQISQAPLLFWMKQIKPTRWKGAWHLRLKQIYIYIYIHMCICIHTCVYIFIHIYVYIYVYIKAKGHIEYGIDHFGLKKKHIP